MARILQMPPPHDHQRRHQPPPQQQQLRKKKDNHLAFAFGFLFLLILVGVLVFSKRSLEPATSFYTNLPLTPASTLPSNHSLFWGAPVELRNVSGFDGTGNNKTTLMAKPNPSLIGSPGRDPIETGPMDERCDLYDGSWVRDEDGRYPLYSPGSCPYVDDAYTCQENGRKDNEYLKWRWKPHGCDLPRFNATDFLERIRGRRLMFVGDSMNRNQFESMLCLLREALPNKSRMYETRGYRITKGRGYFIFKFVDYDCTVEFCRSHFLVKEGTYLNAHRKSRPTLMIDRIAKSSPRWKRSNILIFNTGHWWAHGKTAKGKDYYQEGGVIYPKFDAMEAFRRAIRTWGKWIDANMKCSKTMVFYRGYSTAHFRGGDWDSGGTCHGEKEPILRGKLLNNYPLKMRIVEEVIQDMKFPVILLNVTKLTNFRKDGHPSIYGKVRTDRRRVSKRKQDCSHWCLPGVPDTWNELIYANLLLKQTKRPERQH